MLKAILRTTLFASAAYGIYAVAKKYYPSQVNSAVDSAKSFGNEALSTAKSFVGSTSEQIKHKNAPTIEVSRHAV